MSLTSSMEDYLEAVLVLQQQKGLCSLRRRGRVFGCKKAFCEPGCQRTV